MSCVLCDIATLLLGINAKMSSQRLKSVVLGIFHACDSFRLVDGFKSISTMSVFSLIAAHDVSNMFRRNMSIIPTVFRATIINNELSSTEYILKIFIHGISHKQISTLNTIKPPSGSSCSPPPTSTLHSPPRMNLSCLYSDSPSLSTN